MASDTLGDRIKAARHAAGMTQAALAERADTSTTYIAQVEGGFRTPSLKLLYALATEMGTTAALLLHDGEFDHYDMVTSPEYELQENGDLLRVVGTPPEPGAMDWWGPDRYLSALATFDGHNSPANEGADYPFVANDVLVFSMFDGVPGPEQLEAATDALIVYFDVGVPRVGRLRRLAASHVIVPMHRDSAAILLPDSKHSAVRGRLRELVRSEGV